MKYHDIYPIWKKELAFHKPTQKICNYIDEASEGICLCEFEGRPKCVKESDLFFLPDWAAGVGWLKTSKVELEEKEHSLPILWCLILVKDKISVWFTKSDLGKITWKVNGPYESLNELFRKINYGPKTAKDKSQAWISKGDLYVSDLCRIGGSFS